jgi:hypothetical protein
LAGLPEILLLVVDQGDSPHYLERMWSQPVGPLEVLEGGVVVGGLVLEDAESQQRICVVGVDMENGLEASDCLTGQSFFPKIVHIRHQRKDLSLLLLASHFQSLHRRQASL